METCSAATLLYDLAMFFVSGLREWQVRVHQGMISKGVILIGPPRCSVCIPIS
jgi:hypothetical protein